jgi:hypothetical protein
MIVLHQPAVSLRNVLIGTNNPMPHLEMVALLALVGFLNSLIVLAICGVLLRRLSIRILLAALVIQILCIEFEFSFVLAAKDGVELSIRFAEQFGAILSAVAVGGCVLLVRRHRAAQLTS